MSEADTNRQDDADGTTATGASHRRWSEVAFVLVLLATIVSVFVQALSLPIFLPDETIGPGFFPIVLSVLMIVLVGGHAAYLAIARPMKTAAAERSDPNGAIVTARQLMLVGLVVLALAVGDLIGLLAITGIVLLAGLVLVERVPLRAALIFTLNTLLCVYLVFDLWLGMNVGLRDLFG